ncbi:MAG: signal recognition particle subunit SRP19/SEC65 family protein [Nitrososphaerales archaeon]
MKDYEHQIIWLDYFNKNLTRRKGRKVNRDKAVFDPKIDELEKAVKTAGYNLKEANAEAKFPRRAYVRSGYVMVQKKHNKSKVINNVAERLLQIRSKIKGMQQQQKQKK